MSPRPVPFSLRRLFRKSPPLTLAATAAAAAVAAAVVAGVSTGATGPRTATGALSTPVAATATHAGSHRPPGGHTGRAGQAVLAAFVAPGGTADAGVAPKTAASPNSPPPASASARPQAPRPSHGPAACQSGPQLNRWICQAEQIMIAHGTPKSAIDTGAAVIVVTHESGGNPQASNGWDSNAAAGTPSEGIAQVIAPTFATYHLPGHDNIWNPVDNMVAAFRYAIARYGSMSDIPGVVAVRGGGSYIGY